MRGNPLAGKAGRCFIYRVRNAFFVLVTLAAFACDASSTDTSPSSAPSSQPAAAPTSPAKPGADGGATDAGPHDSEKLRLCAESKGDIGSIADAVTRLNAIVAKGGDGACFVATLPRPLAVVATLNVASAQPAGGRGAPRMFFMLPKLVISAVPEGEGSKVLEFGEWMGTTSTIKGEIALPVTAPLAADAPFQHVLQNENGTKCATCHGQEEPHPTIPKAFVSKALKPSNEVTLEELQELLTLCTTSGIVSSRCDFIHALFDFGEVTQGAFSPVVDTFN
jgi:hypothetical protein